MSASRVLSSVAAIAGLVALAAGAPIACAAAPAPRSFVPPVASEVIEVAEPPAPARSATPVVEAPKPARFAVATENAIASAAAMDVLRRGGTAADAAIAAVLTMGVVQPVSSGLGGGGFALVYDAKERKVTALDFREAAPAGIKTRDYASPGKDPGPKKRGVMTGVPGEAAGLAEMHRRWGKLAFADDVRAAADAADKGFALSAHMARALKWNERWLATSTRYELFHPGGKLLAVGATAKNPALATTLRRFASEGAKAFYEGTIADDVVATARNAGSRMNHEDLAHYRAVERESATTKWEGYEVATMPPPSAGGLMILETLSMHTKADLVALGYGTGAYDHLLAETMRGAVADRVRFVGDPAFVRTDIQKLADPARMKARRATITLDSTTPAEKFALTESGTSHIVVVDGEGDVVSVTSTVNDMFGAKLVTEGGFVLNDELRDFTDPKTLAQFALQRGPNAPHGGARPVSSMTPTIVLKDGVPVFALGGSGGTRIASAVTEVLLAALAFDRAPDIAVADPRIEPPSSGGLVVDPDTAADVVADLRKRGEVVEITKPNYSAVQAISLRSTNGVRDLHAAADPRKGGVALVE